MGLPANYPQTVQFRVLLSLPRHNFEAGYQKPIVDKSVKLYQ